MRSPTVSRRLAQRGGGLEQRGRRSALNAGSGACQSPVFRHLQSVPRSENGTEDAHLVCAVGNAHDLVSCLQNEIKRHRGREYSYRKHGEIVSASRSAPVSAPLVRVLTPRVA